MSCSEDELEDCGCPEVAAEPPECADPEHCDSVFPAECVEYNGADIKCAATAATLYPGVEHFLVLESGTTASKRLPAILGQINEQLCYIFSKPYILQMLTVIEADAELKALFCQIVCSCACQGCDCNTALDVETSAVTEAGLTVEWTGVPGAISYQVVISEISGAIKGIYTIPHSAVGPYTYNVVNNSTLDLEGGVTYQVTIKTVCIANTACYSLTEPVEFTMPDPPGCEPVILNVTMTL